MVLNSDGILNMSIDFGFNLKCVDGIVVVEVVFLDVYNFVCDNVGVWKIGDLFIEFMFNGEYCDV